MKSNDIQNRDDIRALMQKAVKNDDTVGFIAAFDEMLESIKEEVKAEAKEDYDQRLTNLQQSMDSRILQNRGVRQLTSKETEYYQKLIGAMKDRDPKQAVSNLDVVMPKTIIDTVFEDLRTKHPLLSHINFIPSAGAVELIMNTNGKMEAVWGNLTDKIVKELTGGFKKVNTSLLKLTAFLPVAKSMLDLGPDWLDRFVRAVLYEALANGMEAGIIAGDGKEKPIGMIRDVGIGVAVIDGAYPEKTPIKISDFEVTTVGNLLSLLAVDDNGKPRNVTDVILICNPQDYLQKVMPATTVRAPDGTYRSDVMPYPMTIIQSPSVENNRAVLGISSRYFAAAGTAKDGRIEYSDEYHFLEDERVYLIKTYANGMPKDNSSFLYLDISELLPVIFKVLSVTDTPSNVATLSDLKIGNLKLTESFAPETITYTATTKDATNIIKAMPSDAGADIKIMVGETEVLNGTPATWQTGSNTVTIHVTAADGSTTKDYTVTVTKS